MAAARHKRRAASGDGNTALTCQKVQQSRRIDLLPSALWGAQANALRSLSPSSLEGCASLCAGESSSPGLGGCQGALHHPWTPTQAQGWVNGHVPMGGSLLRARTLALCADCWLLADTDFLLLPPISPLKKYSAVL